MQHNVMKSVVSVRHLQYMLLCGRTNLYMNSAEIFSSPFLFFSHCICVSVYVCVRVCIMWVIAFTPALTSMSPFSFGKTSESWVFLTRLWFFSGVYVSLSLLLCVFKWMGSKNPNIRSPLPHLPLSFYRLYLSLFFSSALLCDKKMSGLI